MQQHGVKIRLVLRGVPRQAIARGECCNGGLLGQGVAVYEVERRQKGIPR